MKDPVIYHDTHCNTHHYKRICWSAILVGALVAVGLGFLLNLFGMAIGLSIFTVNKAGAFALALGGYLGIVVATIACMLTAGYAAGYLGRRYCPHRNLGIVYGFVTWSLALILSAAVTAHISHYVAAYAHAVSGHTVTFTQEADGKVVAEASPTTAEKTQPVAKVAATPEHLAYSAFMLFILFFIGAASTCVGACWAMTCERDD